MAALFAARDWAIRVEQGLLIAPPEEPKTTLGEVFQRIRKNAENETLMKAWKERTINIEEDIPTTGEPEVFTMDTPEYKLAEYLAYWKARNYGRMAQSLHLYGEPPNAVPQRVRENYASKKLKAFEFLEITDMAAAVTTIKTKLMYEENGSEIERVVNFRPVNEGTDGRGAVRGKPNCTWVIYTVFV